VQKRVERERGRMMMKAGILAMFVAKRRNNERRASVEL
jgi:hypothetical protein